MASDLPFPLALAIGKYVRAENPFVKLHRLTDAAELLTHFAVTVVLSDLLRQYGEFPDAMRKALAEKIARPTLGRGKISCPGL